MFKRRYAVQCKAVVVVDITLFELRKQVRKAKRTFLKNLIAHIYFLAHSYALPFMFSDCLKG